MQISRHEMTLKSKHIIIAAAAQRRDVTTVGFVILSLIVLSLSYIHILLASVSDNSNKHVVHDTNSNFITHLPPSLLFNNNDTGSYNAEEDEVSSSSSFPGCRHTASLFHTEDHHDSSSLLLEDAIQQNIRFHQHGGNLKSVETFMNKAIDLTLEKHKIKFIPNESKNDKKNKNNDTSSGGGDGDGTHKVTEYLQEYYKSHYDPRGGYGKPLPGRFQTSAPGSTTTKALLLADRYVNVIEPTEGRLKWDASLGPIGPACTNLTQLGGDAKSGDGYKFMCLPPPNNNNNNNSEHDENKENENKKKKECHVISAGGNDNWKFEIALTDALPHCTTHTFDCTLPNGQPKHKPKQKNVKFYNYCLAGTSYNDTHGRQYLSYIDMLHVAGIHINTTGPPTYFKIDVEGFEYDIFSSMIAYSKEMLPLQIQVELHWATRMLGLSWMTRTRSSGELSIFAGMMFTGGGYVPVHLDFNPHCTPCMEVLYVQAVC